MKKYIYLLIIGLLASFASCSDSEIDNMDANGKDEGNITLRIALPQNENRLLFNEYEEDGMPVIKTKFESGDVVYLYNAQGNILRDDDGVPVKFEYKKMQGNNGIFGTNNDGSGSISNSVTSGNYNAVLVGKAFTDSNVFDTSKKFDEILNELPASGTQIGSGTEAGLNYIQTTLGVFKANEARTFSEQPNGTCTANDVYNFTPQYSIVKLTLDEPTIPEEDVLNPTTVIPSEVTFVIYSTVFTDSPAKYNFNMKLEGFTQWEGSEIYIPVPYGTIPRISILAENKTENEAEKRVFVYNKTRTANPIEDGAVHTLNAALSSKLYLKTINDIPGIATYAPAGGTLTLWDGDDDDPTGKAITISRFTKKIRDAFNKRTSSIGLNFPELTSFPDQTKANDNEAYGFGCFRNVAKISHVTAPKVTSVGTNAFDNCTALTNIDLPSVLVIGNYGFNECEVLTNPDLPSVTDIGDYGFNGCKSISQFKSKTLKKIGVASFQDCPNLSEFTAENLYQAGYSAFAISTDDTELVDVTFTLGTNLPEIDTTPQNGTYGVFIKWNIFNHRFKNTEDVPTLSTWENGQVRGFLMNSGAKKVHLVIGKRFAEGGNYGVVYTGSPKKFKVTTTTTYADTANNTNGRYFWINDNTVIQNSNMFMFGEFSSITIRPYPELPSDGETSGNAPEFGNGGTLDK